MTQNNKKYIWISEKGKNVCNKCLQLDGKIFSEDEIPPRPHPNCRCEIQEVKSDKLDIIDKKIKSTMAKKLSQTKSDMIFDAGLKFGGKIMRQYNAAMFWDISYSRFKSKEALEYIEKNGRLVEKVSDLNNDKLEFFIRKKLESQIHKQEAKGIIFYENSSVSQKIAKDENFNKKISQIIKDNQNYINLNYKIDNIESSLEMFSDEDLQNAYGKIDILNINKDAQGNIYALVIDVYDFNADEDNPLVQRGEKIQNANNLENYYSITVVKIKKK